MELEEAEKLVNKAMSVILSCRTMDQLSNAVTYSRLVYKLLAKEIGLVNNSNFICLIERSMGYAQCRIESITERNIK
jgi:hypothetical protein